jgi:hypothetical protein
VGSQVEEWMEAVESFEGMLTCRWVRAGAEMRLVVGRSHCSWPVLQS